MADSQINEPPSSDTSPVRAPEAQPPQESSIVCDCWQQMVQAVMGIVLLLGALAMVHYYTPTTAAQRSPPAICKSRFTNSPRRSSNSSKTRPCPPWS